MWFASSTLRSDYFIRMMEIGSQFCCLEINLSTCHNRKGTFIYLLDYAKELSKIRSLVFVQEEEQQEQSLKLALGQPWVWSVSDFIFLASAYEGGWPVLTLIVSSSHWQFTVSVLIIAELSRGVGGVEISNQISALDGIWTPKPLDWQSSTVTTRPPRTPNIT